MKTLLFISGLILSISCGNTKDNAINYADDMLMESAEVMAPMQSAPRTQQKSEPIEKKVIKSGGIDFQSDDVQKDYDRIKNLLPDYGAYIENENQSKSSDRISYNLKIRVPSNSYDSLFVAISNITSKLENKYSNIEDVTERYYDLKSRIKNKKELEQRYLDILKDAANVRDVLEVERNLNEVRTEIERLEGQFRYLSKQVDFSSIHVSFYELLPYQYDSSERKGFGARLLSALNQGWQGFLFFLVGLTSLWPFFILAGAGIYLFKRFRPGRKARKNKENSGNID